MLEGKELKVFLKLCKAIRREQNLRKDTSLSTSMFIYTDIFGGWVWEDGMGIKQMYAIMYKLENMGFVKIKKTKYKTYAALGNKGVEFVKQLKSRG
jgi:hypothetical protein